MTLFVDPHFSSLQVDMAGGVATVAGEEIAGGVEIAAGAVGATGTS